MTFLNYMFMCNAKIHLTYCFQIDALSSVVCHISKTGPGDYFLQPKIVPRTTFLAAKVDPPIKNRRSLPRSPNIQMAKRRRPGVVEAPSLDDLLSPSPVKKRLRLEESVPDNWSVEELANYLNGLGLDSSVSQACKGTIAS